MSTKTLILGILAISLAWYALHWAAKRDRTFEESAATYEACVNAQYHTTPAAWYNEHGAYPECHE